MSRAAKGHEASGTTVYMSPQQLLGEPSLPTDDVYSLGATLYELLTSKPPFYTGDIEDQIRFRLPEPIERRQRELHVVNPIPAQVARVIMACLAKDAKARPGSIQEVAERLNLAKKTQRKSSQTPPAKPGEQSSRTELAETSAPSADSLANKPAQADQEKPRSSKKRPKAGDPVAVAPAAPPTAPPSETSLRPEQPRRRLVWSVVVFLSVLVAMSVGLVNHFSSENPHDHAEWKRQRKAAQDRQQAILDKEAVIKIATDKLEMAKQQIAAERIRDEAKRKDEETKAKRKDEETQATLRARTNAAPVPPPLTNTVIPPSTKPPPASFPVASRPWTNTLGMIFLPVSELGPLFSLWETRVQDYQAFTNQAKPPLLWKRPDFTQATNHPTVNIRWTDARAFCLWLTKKEHDDGKLNTNQAYRLPRAQEWDLAAGFAAMGTNAILLPPDLFLWGKNWPPPTNLGNFYGQEASSSGIRMFRDGFTNTAPVGSFATNRHGLFDMAGNVWEWCEDTIKQAPGERVAKGGSWNTGESEKLRANFVQSFRTNIMLNDLGFRCVLDVRVLTDK